MITRDEMLKGQDKLNLKILVIGPSGSGKTYFSATAPKTLFLITGPGEEDTFKTHPELRKNIYGYDIFIPISSQDTKRVFQDLVKAIENARQLAKEGKIETLVLDNITYLAENRWIYINEYEKEVTNSGALNTMAMYGKLNRWLYQFVLMKLLTFKGNVFVTAHEQLETDENLDKKPDKSCPVLPNVLGGFRNAIEGMFSCVLYLTKLKVDKSYRYMARTNKGNRRNGKNRYNLKEIIEDISYSTIHKHIVDSLKNKV